MTSSEKKKPLTLYVHAYNFGKPAAIQRHQVSTASGLKRIVEKWIDAEHWTIGLVFESLDQSNPFDITFQDGKCVGPNDNFGYGDRCSIENKSHAPYKGLMGSYDVLCSIRRCQEKRPPPSICVGCERLECNSINQK